MVNNIIPLDDTVVRFKEDTHQYFDSTGSELKSVSRVIKQYVPVFDSKAVSGYMAKGIAAEKGISVEQAQRELLAKWDAKRDSASDHGNWIHNGIEKSLLTGECEERLRPAASFVHALVKDSYRFFPEKILYSIFHGVAGQTDLMVQRQKSNNSVVDFFDYKTNESKGIVFDSIGRKSKEIKHYNQYMLHPLSHLESCNYIHYCLQLSLYAYMASVSWGVKVGRLAIIFVGGEDLLPHMIPIPYMMLEAKLLLEDNMSRKPLPQVKSMPLPSPAKESVKQEVNSDDDDW